MADIVTVIPVTKATASAVPAEGANAASGIDSLFAALLQQLTQDTAAGAAASANDSGQPTAENDNGETDANSQTDLQAAQQANPYSPFGAPDLIALLQNADSQSTAKTDEIAGTRQVSPDRTDSTNNESDTIDETLATLDAAAVMLSQQMQAQAAAATLSQQMQAVASRPQAGEGDAASAVEAAIVIGEKPVASSKDAKPSQTRASAQPPPDSDVAAEDSGKATTDAKPLAAGANASKNGASATSTQSALAQVAAQPQNPQPSAPAADINAPSDATAAVQAPANATNAASLDASLQIAPQRQSAGDASSATLDTLGVAIAAKSSGGVKHFDIRLEPPELGRVEVRLSIDAAGKVQASLVVDKPQTLELLQSDASNLNRALSGAGLEVSNNGLNFSLRGQDRQNDSGNAPDERGRALAVGAVAGTDTISNSGSIVSLAPDSVRLDIRV